MTAIYSQARVISNEKITPLQNIYRMYLSVGDRRFAYAQPGQFLMVGCGGDTLLMRPFGVFDVRGNDVGFCYEVRGKGTKLLSECKNDDLLTVNGPLGQGFSLPVPESKSERALLIGGGIGIFPLYYAAQKCECDAILGFRSDSFVNSLELFERECGKLFVCTDDGSYGQKGFVSDLLPEALDSGKYSSVHICGPIPMMRACSEITQRYGIRTEVSMEERMGCGVGACYACVCKVRSADGLTNKRVCLEGPVFSAADIAF